MHSGTLIKEGKNWKIKRVDVDKIQTIAGDFGLEDGMNGKEVEFDNTGGPVKLIRFEGKDYIKKQAPGLSIESRFSTRDGKGGGYDRRQRSEPGPGPITAGRTDDPGRAPYNFISLSDPVVKNNVSVDHSRYENLSGVIILQVEAKTPLFIKGYDGNFFRVKDQPYIPGSTIRGMVRNMVQITSDGKMDQYDDVRHYRRSSLFPDGNDIHAGFMRLENGVFKVFSAVARQERNDRFNLADYHYSYGRDNKSCTYATGAFGQRPIIWYFEETSTAPAREVQRRVIDGYQSDDQRNEFAVDLFRSLKKGKVVNKTGKPIGNTLIPQELGIPVFFRIGEDNNIFSIGHAKYHRIPYSKSVGDLIPASHKVSAPDLGAILFGTVEHATKVCFEDLRPNALPVNLELEKPMHPKILSSPKPTTYQHYLKQPGVQKTWNHPDAEIRGFKQYWHRDTSSNPQNKNSWIETGDITDSHADAINPVVVGTNFTGRIRFDNLAPEELGALLFALDLPGECAHKLGMGKPLGLGSVRITPTLILTKRTIRYSSVFDADGNWLSAEYPEENLDQFINAFAAFIGRETARQNIITNADTYWTIDDRMKRLKEMLTLRHNFQPTKVGWGSRTRYMEIQHSQTGKNEFKKRPVLPEPDQVVQEDRYRNP